MSKQRRQRGSSEELRWAISEILSTEAEFVPEVGRFREAVGGKPLGVGEAKRWLRGHALKPSGYNVSLPKRLRLEVGETSVGLNPSHPEVRLFSDAVASLSTWEQAQAVGFILCGFPPTLSPVGVAVSYRVDPTEDRIILEVRRGATVAEVIGAFRRARTLVRAAGRESPALRSRAKFRSRQPSAKTCNLAVFVARTAELSWKERMERWNAEFPEWRYKTVSRFNPDGLAAYRTVTGRAWDQRKRRSNRIASEPASDRQ